MSEEETSDNLRSRLIKVNSLKALDELKAEYFGKNGCITAELKKLSQLNPDEKRARGSAVNSIKISLLKIFAEKEEEILAKELNVKLQQDKLDVTLPSRAVLTGSIHPISQALEELLNIFAQFGFLVADGPNIEDEWHNFSALNMSDDHPARQMHDTFYLKSGNLLRTHTSPIQIRMMKSSNLPIRIVAPGRAYRSDFDMTHTPMFHQIEGLVIDKNINMGHLKYLINQFIKIFFEKSNIETLFRPSFFPFTEPSAEVDIKFSSNHDWLEVLGCGMVHPNVLKNVGIDHNQYQGFAFGLGIERFAMLKYGINDLRKFFEGEQRWLSHYSFSAFDVPSLIGGLTR